MRNMIIIAAMLMIASGCSQGTILDNECESDNDCATGGCSGEVCQAKSEPPAASICSYKEEYECLKMISCKCLDGKCQWDTTEEYWGCVEEKKKGE